MARLAVDPKVVSNPHRYGQKPSPLLHAGGGARVSNPHRYGQKLGRDSESGREPRFKPS